MNQETFDSLQAGDIIIHRNSTNAVVVHDNLYRRVTAVQVYIVTNPDEWNVVYGMKYKDISTHDKSLQFIRPTNENITEMSQTLEGAKKATLWKWEWLYTATAEEILYDPPKCGLCSYYSTTCSRCELWGYSNSCNDNVNPFQDVVRARENLRYHLVTLDDVRQKVWVVLDAVRKL